MRRRRALLFAFLAGAIAAAGGAAFGTAAATWHDTSTKAPALARADLVDVPAPTALTRTRDGSAREHGVAPGVVVALGLALALTLAGGWWLTREHIARVRSELLLTIRRTRAPPGVPATVHC
jgi:hypothetical protein